ncbi:LysR family transcriptional regulator [Azospirillum baldaniorum]|uniref:Transcriptional regulator, LysR family (ModE-like) n=4 Tax=Azospirillum TaxID=191 RepID=A0A9P1JSS0_9PROT|nr:MULTISPECIES: LysR family transcriptional regulator [Azospirillum]AWJ89072.1 LysR family transcriptional regulator [Azospirillum baldaniorum]NUB08266.1 LysR family transcriptional regulator [Azospirillum baldaniorum]PNQ97999.1 LysR family transcriptional regulator [Azospirillum argentinense]QCO15592.1 LysR family transcriptional regulator [Azospirillum brasilense]TWA66260.1 molybdate transport system regulatory protein [Azospirillum baldaniorum]
MTTDIRLRFLHPSGAIGPGKVSLLEEIDRTGSISAAARALGMSFRRAWFLVETMNSAFREPVVRTNVGGREGGGTGLTAFGQEVIARYRRMEEEARRAAAPHLAWLDEALKPEAALEKGADSADPKSNGPDSGDP